MVKLERQLSELDAVERSFNEHPARTRNANADAANAECGDDDASAASSLAHTPAKGVVTIATPVGSTSPTNGLKVKTHASRPQSVKTEEDAVEEKGGGKVSFARALEDEIEQRHHCQTPATTASAMPLHAEVAKGDAEAVRRLASECERLKREGDVGGARKGGAATWPPPKAPLSRIDSRSELKNSERLSVDARNEHGDTALAVACALEDADVALEMVSILVDCGADVKVVSNGYAPIHWACRLGHVEVVKLLVARQNDDVAPRCESLRTEEGMTPLLVASEFGMLETIRALVSDPISVDVSARDSQGRDVLAVLGTKMRRQSQSARIDMRAELFSIIPSLRLAFLTHPDCEEHVSFKPHQESPERIVAIMAELEKTIARGELTTHEIEKMSQFEPATPHDILRAHSEHYVRVLAELSDRVGHTPIAFTPYCQDQQGVPEKFRKPVENSDTFFSPGTLQAALRASGGVIHSVDRVLTGSNRSAFVCCRPPGHHAGVEGATDGAPSSGFSILNNAMIGALYAIEERKCMRVAVVDFDVHHGNGTEEIARHWLRKQRSKVDYRRHSSPDLFFASIHLADDGTSSGINFYPGTGVQDDMVHNIVNVVVPPMWLAKGASATANGDTGERVRKKAKRFGDDDSTPQQKEKPTETELQGGRLEWMKSFRERLIPALRAFGPELVIVSAGFDAAASDVGNLGIDPKKNTRHQGVNLRPEDYEAMTRMLLDVSHICDGRLVSVLEGGYGHLKTTEAGLTLSRDVFAKCVQSHVNALIS